MSIFSYGQRSSDVLLIQKALSLLLKKQLTLDGVFGKYTEEAVRQLQQIRQLPVTGKITQLEQLVINEVISNKLLKDSFIIELCQKENLDFNIIKAFIKTEGRINGFLPDGRVIILFERHKFYNNLVRKYGVAKADEFAISNPDICNKIKGGYTNHEEEHNRLSRAKSIDYEAAVKSTRYGLFQITGEKHLQCGYYNFNIFEQFISSSESEQFKAFISLIKSNPQLVSAIKQSNHERIIKLYYGTDDYTGDIVNKFKNNHFNTN